MQCEIVIINVSIIHIYIYIYIPLSTSIYADAPRIQCTSSTAYVGDRNVRVTCDVTARPRVTSWFWVLDDNGTTISEREVIDGYWTIVTVSFIDAMS